MRKSLPAFESAVMALSVMGAFAVALPRPANADDVTPPPVPTGIKVPAGNKAFFMGHGVGTQNYVCLPAGSGFAWTLFTPLATLFDDDDGQLTTHFFSPNPFDVIRAAWQHSRDTSTVWAKLFRDPSFDRDFVALDAIPWLLLERDGVQEGPTGGDRLTATTFIHRLNTAGGVAPSTGCSSPTDVGRKASVPYEADYFFYKEATADDRN